MYVYLVVLMLDGGYAVHTPNSVFSEQQDCLYFKLLDGARLEKIKPSTNAKFYSTCIKIPKDVDTSTWQSKVNVLYIRRR